MSSTVLIRMIPFATLHTGVIDSVAFECLLFTSLVIYICVAHCPLAYVSIGGDRFFRSRLLSALFLPATDPLSITAFPFFDKTLASNA